MADPMLGEIRLFPYSYEPEGWDLCDGRQMLISQYSTLYATIGATYGGDGQTYFNLPDLRARVAVGFGNDPDDTFDPTLGATGGVESVALSAAQVPPHTHTLNAATITPPKNNVASPAGNWIGRELLVKASGNEAAKAYAPSVPPDATLNNGTLTPQGIGQAHENRQPYLVLGYYMAIEGQFFPKP